jgi:hypothetical protein
MKDLIFGFVFTGDVSALSPAKMVRARIFAPRSAGLLGFDIFLSARMHPLAFCERKSPDLAGISLYKNEIGDGRIRVNEVCATTRHLRPQ